MFSFVRRRMYTSALPLIIVLLGVFLLARLTGDPTSLYLPESATAEQRALAATPLVPLFHSENYELLRAYVHGVTITPLGILNLKDAYIDREH